MLENILDQDEFLLSCILHGSVDDRKEGQVIQLTILVAYCEAANIALKLVEILEKAEIFELQLLFVVDLWLQGSGLGLGLILNSNLCGEWLLSLRLERFFEFEVSKLVGEHWYGVFRNFWHGL
jgi:hypothetical protein